MMISAGPLCDAGHLVEAFHCAGERSLEVVFDRHIAGQGWSGLGIGRWRRLGKLGCE
jgi:hypothetical protein